VIAQPPEQAQQSGILTGVESANGVHSLVVLAQRRHEVRVLELGSDGLAILQAKRHGEVLTFQVGQRGDEVLTGGGSRGLAAGSSDDDDQFLVLQAAHGADQVGVVARVNGSDGCFRCLQCVERGVDFRIIRHGQQQRHFAVGQGSQVFVQGCVPGAQRQPVGAGVNSKQRLHEVRLLELDEQVIVCGAQARHQSGERLSFERSQRLKRRFEGVDRAHHFSVQQLEGEGQHVRLAERRERFAAARIPQEQAVVCATAHQLRPVRRPGQRKNPVRVTGERCQRCAGIRVPHADGVIQASAGQVRPVRRPGQVAHCCRVPFERAQRLEVCVVEPDARPVPYRQHAPVRRPGQGESLVNRQAQPFVRRRGGVVCGGRNRLRRPGRCGVVVATGAYRERDPDQQRQPQSPCPPMPEWATH